MAIFNSYVSLPEGTLEWTYKKLEGQVAGALPSKNVTIWTQANVTNFCQSTDNLLQKNTMYHD